MELYFGSEPLKVDHPRALHGAVITIGNFDGVHIGHRALLSEVLQLAQQDKAQGPSVVFTFDPHPVQILHPERQMAKIFTLEDQREQLQELGLEVMVVQAFSRDFSELGPERFLQDYIFTPFQPRALVVGYDFAFGSHRQGHLDLVEDLARQRSCQVRVVPALTLGGEAVSSSRIRRLVLAGEMRQARQLLGRPYFVQGAVIRGMGRGRTLGIPTANLLAHSELFPKLGVYSSRVVFKQQLLKAITNIGYSPTFDHSLRPALKIETHIFDFNQDLYGEVLKVQLLEYLREERTFPGPQELQAQIHQDIQKARQTLESLADENSEFS